MVSVELMMREVRSPVRLSGPYSLKISRTSPVAAEEENILMSKRGMIGAGISASLTHFATIIYQWIVFKRVTGVSSKELAISKEDVAVFKDIIISFKDKLSRKG